MSEHYRVTRVRRDALPAEVNALLSRASVGSWVHLTFYGVPSDAVITELTDDWVEFESGREVVRVVSTEAAR
ncbi:MAG: hypothetical protein ACXVXJ_04720 [Mycobacteriaceae bacterium]